MKPAEWGASRVEIIVVQDIVLDLLHKGYPINLIWRELSSTSKITMSKHTFYRAVRQFRKIWAEVGRRHVTGWDFHRKSR
jgi:hypothetical protein